MSISTPKWGNSLFIEILYLGFPRKQGVIATAKTGHGDEGNPAEPVNNNRESDMTDRVLTIEDVERIEATPLERRLSGSTGYEALMQVVSKFPDRVAITALERNAPLGAGRNVTFSELLAQVNRAANMLRSRGLAADESVTHFLPLVPEAFYVMLAAETVGIINPVNPMLEVEHIVDITRSANTRILVIPGRKLSQELFDKGCETAAANPLIHSVYVLGGEDECDGKKFLPLEASIAEQGSGEIIGGTAGTLDDPVAYFHTGGSTGVPKLARHTQRMRLAQTISTGSMMGCSEKDCVVQGLPMFHVAGSVILGLIPLFNGSRVLLLSPDGFRDKVALDAFWRVIEKHQVSILMAVPTVLSALQNVPPDNADLSSLRSVLTGGSAVPRTLMKDVGDMLGIDVAQGFGMTEIAGMGLIQTRPEGDRNLGSSGLRGPYIEVKIARQDANGAVVGEADTNEIGVLCFRGPCVMTGYVDGRAQAEAFTNDGWLNTGDLARMDEQGEVWVTGRAKDVIIRSGHNIDALIIEDALQSHPDVEIAAAVGKPDEYAGELPIAYVQLKPGAVIGADELRNYARQNIVERAAAPTEVILVDDIPKTGVDKVFKPALRLDAIRRTYEDAIANHPGIQVEATVEVGNHPTAGVMASISLYGKRSQNQEALVCTVLSPFPIQFSVEWQPVKGAVSH
jgi:fatty-acyl-CoA synthase